MMGAIIKRDEQEALWKKLLRLWIDRKITYKELIKYYPDGYKRRMVNDEKTK